MEEKKYTGMTVNERLYESGLSKDFYNAVARKDIEEVVSILKKVELNDNSILPILKSLELK